MEFFAKTDLGLKRQINQDYILTRNNKIGIFPNLFIVADGVGSNFESGYASSFCSNFVCDQLALVEDGMNYKEEIEKAMRLANLNLFYKILANNSYKGMGTTMVLLTIVNNKAIIANVGDSRCYLIRDNIMQITHDHTVAEELAATLKIERYSKEYYEYKNQLTRAFGAGKKIEPDFFVKELIKGDYLLLCTDGLTNMVSNEKIYSIISQNMSIEDKVNKLVETANENGGKDNIGVILIYVDDIKIITDVFEEERQQKQIELLNNIVNKDKTVENDVKIYTIKKTSLLKGIYENE